MDALKTLTSRISITLVREPGPSKLQLDEMLKAGMRAADHHRLRPWRFLHIEREQRKILGKIFLEARLIDGVELDETERVSILQKPLRAPLILVVIASISNESDVPEIEQIISAGAVAQNVLNACHAMHLGAMWRTGAMAYHPKVKSRLGLGQREHIVGFLYLGQIRGRLKKPPKISTKDYIERWSGN